jgi:protein-L-isoaspartate(D-aspartate) O-methyltransferase
MGGQREEKLSDPGREKRNQERFQTARRKMVETQLRRRGITDEAVLAAMEQVPREKFVPATHLHDAYADNPLPIGCDQTISQPYVVALMLQELEIEPHHRVLDVGAGSGYQTAILARLAAHVFAVERIEELAQRAGDTLDSLKITNVTFTTADGSLGLPDHAPFDRIISGAASPDVPQPWIDQLADQGRIIAPVGASDVQTLLLVIKDGDKIRRRQLSGVRFVKLIGELGW